MARYLEYSSLTLKMNEEKPIEDEPESFGPVCIFGPEPEFAEYLNNRYEGLSWVACGGRLVTGQLWPNVISTIAMTLGPGLAYMNYYLPMALGQPPNWNSFLGRSSETLACIILVSFLLSSFSNPGIVPRRESMPKEKDFPYVKWLTVRQPANRPPEQPRPADRYLRIRDITLKQKWCLTCNIYRPPRSKHCSYCDNCVLRFDHHCTWLGNCVGLYNYRFFVVLIYSATLFLIETIITILHIIGTRMYSVPDQTLGWWGHVWIALENFLAPLWQEPWLCLLFCYCCFLFVAVLLLSIYHTVVTLQNMTTNEHVKEYYKWGNPFDYGGTLNCQQIYCHPERVLAAEQDVIEMSSSPFGQYSHDLSYEEL